MNLHHVELFAHVARFGGISRAVRNMPYGIQQPAVSAQMIKLERELGVKLFHRQPFRLTPEGRALWDCARPLLEGVDQIEGLLRARHTPALRIAAPELVLQHYLPEAIRTFRQTHPEVRWVLRTGDERAIENALCAGEIDLAISTKRRRVPSPLRSFPVARIPLALLVPADSPLQAAGELWTQQRVDIGLVALPITETVTWAFVENLRRLRVEWPIAVEAPSTATIASHVASGSGIGVTVDVPVVRSYAAVRVLPLPQFEPVDIALVSRPNVTGVATAFQAVLKSQAVGRLGSRRKT